MNDIFVRLAEMPAAVRGQVRVTADGDFLIFINSAYNREQQLEIYRHEMTHILRSHHWQTGRAVADVEAEARAMAVDIEDILRAEAAGVPLGTQELAKQALARPMAVQPGAEELVGQAQVRPLAVRPDAEEFAKQAQVRPGGMAGQEQEQELAGQALAKQAPAKQAPARPARVLDQPSASAAILAELDAWFEEWEHENERRIDRAERRRDNLLGLRENGL